MKTTLQIVEELAAARNAKDAADQASTRARVEARRRKYLEQWKPVTDMLQELHDADKISLTMHDEALGEIYFVSKRMNRYVLKSYAEDDSGVGPVGIEGSSKSRILSAPTPVALIPGLISLLADLIR